MIQVLMMLTQSHLIPDLSFLWREAPVKEVHHQYAMRERNGGAMLLVHNTMVLQTPTHRPKALPVVADKLRTGRYSREVAIQFGRMAEQSRLYLMFCQLKIDG
jgi:hypothetical protein